VISENTLDAMKYNRQEFDIQPLGEHTLRGKQELIWLYRLLPTTQPASQAAALEQASP
jgi:class 3 adenylate cyclase